MSDRIRYARGHSAHGDFVAAMSENGLVAVEFSAPGGNVVAGLLARFPDAVLEEDVTGLATTVATLSRAVGPSAADHAPAQKAQESVQACGILAHSNRLVRKNGSVAGGRACAASVQAARRALTGAPRAS